MAFALKLAQRLPKSLRVVWEDGLAAHFTYVWLRDNGHRRPSLIHLDLYAKPQEVDCNKGELSVVWPPFLPSHYSSQFLREHTTVKRQPCATNVTKKVLKAPWRMQPRPSFEDNSHMAILEWGERARECATIWPQFDRVPSIVAVESMIPNGKVNVVDAVYALGVMAQTYPKQFEFLLSNPVEFEHGFFKATHRTAELQDGKIVAAVFNNELRSSEITCDSMEDLYTSLKLFNKICCDLSHTVVLQPGELLVTDNAQTFIGAPAQCGRKLQLRLFD